MPSPQSRLTTVERARIGAEILSTYAFARWWLVRYDVRGTVAAARAVQEADGAVAPDATLRAARIGRAVERTLAALPFDGRCLVRSLVLTRMLARRGIDATFVLGVRAKPTFLAHAWLERDGVPLLPTSPEFERIAEL
jgi:hypothetical protein